MNWKCCHQPLVVQTFGLPHCSHLMYLAAGKDNKHGVRLRFWRQRAKRRNQTHVSAPSRSSCAGSGIFSSACFWTGCRWFLPDPRAPSSGTPSSCRPSCGSVHWPPGPWACVTSASCFFKSVSASLSV